MVGCFCNRHRQTSCIALILKNNTPHPHDAVYHRPNKDSDDGLRFEPSVAALGSCLD